MITSCCNTLQNTDKLGKTNLIPSTAENKMTAVNMYVSGLKSQDLINTVANSSYALREEKLRRNLKIVRGIARRQILAERFGVKP